MHSHPRLFSSVEMSASPLTSVPSFLPNTHTKNDYNFALNKTVWITAVFHYYQLIVSFHKMDNKIIYIYRKHGQIDGRYINLDVNFFSKNIVTEGILSKLVHFSNHH